MKKFALLDLIKFHELENEKEQTRFIKKGDDHFPTGQCTRLSTDTL